MLSTEEFGPVPSLLSLVHVDDDVNTLSKSQWISWIINGKHPETQQAIPIEATFLLWENLASNSTSLNFFCKFP